MSTDARTTLSGPTGLRGRVPAPDLARGAMLLLISLANTPFYLWGGARSESGMHPADATGADAIVQGLLITFVDARVYPMFAVLFGYGLFMIYRRQAAHGVPEPQAFRLLQRRNLWMLAFGLVHAALLWGGDVMGAYGLTGLLVVWLFVRRRDRTLLIWAGVGVALLLALVLLTALTALLVLATGEEMSEAGGMPDFLLSSASDPSYLASVLARLSLWVVLTVLAQGPVGVTVPVAVLLGVWASRRMLLERPREHRRLLRRVAIIGIAIGWSEGLLHALAHTALLPGLRDVVWAFATPQLLAGLACGVGYVAAFGLLGARLQDRDLGILGSAVCAVGKRSMSCYLAQSVLCAPVLAAWGLGLGEHLTSATMALYAVAVWLVTVAGAVVLERRGVAGPAETLLRRLSYRS